MTIINLIRVSNLPVFKQLQLEEALLRLDDRNWCVINEGSPPAVVLGISNKPEKHLDLAKLERDQIPVIKRFSGGGSVVVDSSTYLSTFICNSEDFNVPCIPQSVLLWGERIYKKMVPHPEFHLCENDFAIGSRKCGGNAQYFRNKRWLLHSSFLWDFDPKKMSYLHPPPKMPKYRQSRSHDNFLCRLRDSHPSLSSMSHCLLNQLRSRFTINDTSIDEVLPLLESPHRQSTKIIFNCNLSPYLVHQQIKN